MCMPCIYMLSGGEPPRVHGLSHYVYVHELRLEM
jgi:hypothetical protein